MTALLGRIGVWSRQFVEAPWREVRPAVARIEELGYGALWYPEVPLGREAVSTAALLLVSTSRVAVCSGIASIWARDAVAAGNAAYTLNEAFDSRFVLGIGVSHAPSVEERGHEFGKPLATMRRYLDELDALAERRGLEPCRPMLAALAPHMLALARERALGSHTYFVPVEHTAIAREALGSGRLLAVELAVVADTDPHTAREHARTHSRLYLQRENYRRNLLRLGFDEESFGGGGSDDLIDAVVSWGDFEAISSRVNEHFDAGADHIAIQPITASIAETVAVLEELARRLGTADAGKT